MAATSRVWMSKIIVHPQVEGFVRSLAPEPRRRLITAMKALPAGNTKALEGRLAGYCRLREGGYRVIYSDSVKAGVRTFDCIFAERRSFIYDLFEQIIAEDALE
jgi:mRNA-degrading endonuclease RelE of RelBE toxin-antitoxin system